MQIIQTLEAIPSVMAYFTRIGAKPRGINYGVVERDRGKYWVETAVIFIEKEEGSTKGDISVRQAANQEEFRPTPEEQVAIKRELEGWRWPRHIAVPRLDGTEPWAKYPNEGVYEFRNGDGLIEMVQVRIRTEHRRLEGQEEKRYIAWSKWDDEKWRPALPGEKLPLYNAHLIAKGKPSIIILHEGAKAADAVHRMVTGADRPSKAALAAHPWGPELSGGTHVGWIGGALAPHRTDWDVINRAAPEKVIIVCDNDWDGRAAAARIARMLTVPTIALMFDDTFPPGFDLADKFPDDKFATLADGFRYYTGGAFWDHCQPLTWATEAYRPETGRPGYKLRDAFKRQWFYLTETDAYVNLVQPNRLYPSSKISLALGHLSDVPDLGEKMKTGLTEKMHAPAYQPYAYDKDIDTRLVIRGDMRCFNTYRPTRLKPIKGSVAPFMEYMEQLIPDKDERHQLLRWIATLIARPERRIKWHVLLISETQGTGKSTLGDLFLRPIVGPHNTGIASTQSILEGRNDWGALKKLVLIHELYAGHNVAVANHIKSILTEDTVSVNKKFMQPFDADVCFQLLACSNSSKAVPMEDTDRRWFVPKVTNLLWPQAKWNALNEWARSGGQSHVFWWALNDWEDYCTESETAPWTEGKGEMAVDSKSEVMKHAAIISGVIGQHKEPVAVKTTELIMAIKANNARTGDTHLMIRREMEKTKQVYNLCKTNVGGGSDVILGNKAMLEKLHEEMKKAGVHDIKEFARGKNGGAQGTDETLSQAAKVIRPHLKTPSDIMPKNEKGM